MKRSGLLLSLLSLGMIFAAGAGAIPVAVAQMRSSVQRVVEGKVEDKAGAPLKGATIFLKDTKTLAVKSFLSTADGSYHIGQLSSNADYQLWAELDGKKSSNHPISSFDSKKGFTINLKIDTSK